jgi:hypothetical protein
MRVLPSLLPPSLGTWLLLQPASAAHSKTNDPNPV